MSKGAITGIIWIVLDTPWRTLAPLYSWTPLQKKFGSNFKQTKIAGKIYNAGYENQSVKDIAEIVKNAVGSDVTLTTTPSDDNRSYHISSEKIKNELGFVPKHTIRDAVEGLCEAFDNKLLPNSLDDEIYFNIKRMQNINLS